MKDSYTREDLQNPDILSEVIETALIQVVGTSEQRGRLLEQRRNACDKRGFHRVDSEPSGDGELMICYDCDLWFDKKFARNYGVSYKVVSV